MKGALQELNTTIIQSYIIMLKLQGINAIQNSILFCVESLLSYCVVVRQEALLAEWPQTYSLLT